MTGWLLKAKVLIKKKVAVKSLVYCQTEALEVLLRNASRHFERLNVTVLRDFRLLTVSFSYDVINTNAPQ